MLKKSIDNLLSDHLNLNYSYLLLKHPLVNSMKNLEKKRPFQYLEAGIFADALIDIIGDQAEFGIPNDPNKNAKENSRTYLRFKGD